MTYENFCITYKNTFDLMNSYKINEAGNSIYCERLADLADDYPEFLERFEFEIEVTNSIVGVLK